MGKIRRAVMTPLPDGTTRVFTIGQAYTDVLQIVTGSGQVFMQNGTGSFALTNPSTGAVTFDFAPDAVTDTVNGGVVPLQAIFEDTETDADLGASNSVSGSIAPPFDEEGSLIYTIGSDLTFQLVFTNPDGSAKDLTGCTIYMTIKKEYSDSLPIVIGKRSTSPAQIANTNPTSGIANCMLLNGDAIGIDPGDYRGDAWIIDANSFRVPGIRFGVKLLGRASDFSNDT